MKASKQNREKCLLAPSENGKWEAWELAGANASPPAQSYASPAEARCSPQSVMALPMRQLFAVPLWLAGNDPGLLRNMVFLQLERQGLAGGRSSQDLIFDYRTVGTAENKTQVLAVSLPNALPEHLCLDLHRYEPSARVRPLPADAFVLWRESGRLALAVTKGKELAYFQALGDIHPTEAVLQELQCIKLQLEATNLIARVKTVTLWGDFSRSEISAVGAALGLEAGSAPLPAPVLPDAPMDLIPAPVRKTQQAAKAGERKKSIIAMVVGLYLLLLLVIVARIGWYSYQSRQIELQLAGSAAHVEEIQETYKRWNRMEAAIEPEFYPVEQLLQCARLLPADGGVRFTNFSSSDGKIVILGEAKSPQAAFSFAEALGKNNEMRSYVWTMQKPRMQGNTSIFQIQGVRRGATTQK